MYLHGVSHQDIPSRLGVPGAPLWDFLQGEPGDLHLARFLCSIKLLDEGFMGGLRLVRPGIHTICRFYSVLAQLIFGAGWAFKEKKEGEIGESCTCRHRRGWWCFWP